MRNPRRPGDDDPGVNPRRALDDRQVEALLRGSGDADPVLRDAFALLRSAGHGPVPAPSAALAALLAEGLPAPTVRPAPAVTSHRRRAARLGVLVGGLSLAITTAAAGANALPRGAQRTAATVLNTLTPFRFPTPLPRVGRTHPAPATSVVEPTPVSAARPTLEPTRSPSPRQVVGPARGRSADVGDERGRHRDDGATARSTQVSDGSPDVTAPVVDEPAPAAPDSSSEGPSGSSGSGSGDPTEPAAAPDGASSAVADGATDGHDG